MADGWLIVELVCTDFLAVLSITKLLLFLTGKVIGPERRILCAIITSAVGLIILSGLPLPRLLSVPCVFLWYLHQRHRARHPELIERDKKRRITIA